MKIKRSVLVDIIEQSIELGGSNLRQFVKDPMIRSFMRDSLRDMARTCEGVDFGAFECKYGCPITQAHLWGAYGFWFTKFFDRLMHDLLEPGPSLEQGWSVEIVE